METPCFEILNLSVANVIMPYCPLDNSYQPLEEEGGEYTVGT